MSFVSKILEFLFGSSDELQEGGNIYSADDIIEALKRIVNEGGDGNFLIIEGGKYYLQFLGQKGSNDLYCEAVGDIDPIKRLSDHQISMLISNGWNKPDIPSGNLNYSRELTINDDNDFREIAGMTFKVFKEVYELDANEELTFKLNLE